MRTFCIFARDKGGDFFLEVAAPSWSDARNFLAPAEGVRILAVLGFS